MELKNYWVIFLLLFNISFFLLYNFVGKKKERERERIDKGFFEYSLVSLELYIVTINIEKFWIVDQD